MAGGTQEGLFPRRYTYWRVGNGKQEEYSIESFVEQAGIFHCKPNFKTTLVDYPNAAQFYYQFQGRAVLEYGHETVAVTPGDLLIIPPGHPFVYRSSHGLQFHWFCVAGAWPKILEARPSITIYPLGVERIMQTYFAEIREALLMQRAGYPLQALGVFYSLMARIFDLTSPVELPHSSYPESVRNAIVYLRENYTQQFRAAEVSNAIGVSQSHLRALFIKWVGESPQKFHCRCRIDEAKRLLDQRLSITQTAHEVGFNDMRYFSRTFKHVTGITPSAYRDSIR